MSDPAEIELDLSGVGDLPPLLRADRETAKNRIATAQALGTPIDLRGLCLQQVDLREFDLRNARLSDLDLSEANLNHADMSGADLRGTILSGASLIGANLSGADLSFATLKGADLEDCHVDGANFYNATLRKARLSGVHGYRSASWLGVDLAEARFTGAYRLRRFAMDQNYLHEFRRESRLHEAWYWVWWLTSDCGRSLFRWTFVIAFIAVLFGQLYQLAGVDFGEDALWITPYYFSVITLTSLGYGDISPTTSVGQALSMIEVMLGYIALGGLLSIFTNKMARRSG
ncbi:MAG: pentapeptide repeat-containing protein [Myxococcota bacterium]